MRLMCFVLLALFGTPSSQRSIQSDDRPKIAPSAPGVTSPLIHRSIRSLLDNVTSQALPMPLTALSETTELPGIKVDQAWNSVAQKNLCNSAAGLGVCKAIHLCEPYRAGTVKYTNLTRCSFIGFDEIVCCPVMSNIHTSTTTVPPASLTTSTLSTPIEITNPPATDEEKRSHFTIRPSIRACQRYNEGPRSKYNILGGTDAALGEFPYIGAVLYSSQQSGRQYDVGCGATLIAEQFALTAAHCVIRDSSKQVATPELVRFGCLEWNPRENLTYRFDAKIKNITAHELYRPSSYYHDIAVIELSEPAPTSMLISPICLHTSPDDIDKSVKLQIVGWGISSMYSNVKADILQKTDVNTVPLAECNRTHVDFGVSVRYSRGLIDGQYCAFDPEFRKDTCGGDSGGPMTIALDDWDELVGIVSFGKGCGSIVPSIYTRVAHYLDWIEKIVWPSPASNI